MTVQCPGCGAPIELFSRFVVMAFCGYCRLQVAIRKDGVDPLGKSAALADLWPILRVGQRGTLRGREFLCAGRVRYAYEDGYWDEWYLLFEDGDAWLHEDEGDLELVRRVAAPGRVDVGGARPGGRVRVGEHDVYVTEKDRAVIEGGEGQLPRDVKLGGTIDYLDGTAGGRTVMIEVADGVVDVCVGEPVARDEVVVEDGVG